MDKKTRWTLAAIAAVIFAAALASEPEDASPPVVRAACEELAVMMDEGLGWGAANARRARVQGAGAYLPRVSECRALGVR